MVSRLLSTADSIAFGVPLGDSGLRVLSAGTWSPLALSQMES